MCSGTVHECLAGAAAVPRSVMRRSAAVKHASKRGSRCEAIGTAHCSCNTLLSVGSVGCWRRSGSVGMRRSEGNARKQYERHFTLVGAVCCCCRCCCRETETETETVVRPHCIHLTSSSLSCAAVAFVNIVLCLCSACSGSSTSSSSGMSSSFKSALLFPQHSRTESRYSCAIC